MMYTNKLISIVVATLVMPAAFVQAAVIEARKSDLSPDAQVCTGSAAAGNGCVTIPISSDACTDFTGGLSFLNKEVSGAIIPDGFVCTFFEQFGCESAQGGKDTIVLQGGTWSFGKVPGVAGTVNFNDKPSSFECSPV